ncbi:hypothetical protein WME90_42910 [Sorangium sp. So ce375]|uniref:hypothetical protein n=1 Tax=Sorangium sp. So ce375 TaxID=3133306 RepID=UPI003F5C9CAA
MPRGIAALLGFALLGAASSAAATEADELLDKGLADLQASRYGAACPAIRKSYRLEKRPRTLYHLAECEERAGRIATAALHYDEYLDLFERLSPPEQKDEADRQKLALERREKLDADIPWVTFRLPETAPVGTKVTRASEASPDPVPVVLGVPLPVDPGPQWVRTEPPGGPPRDKRFFVNKRERLTIELTVAEPGDEPKTRRYSRPLEHVPALLPPTVDEGLAARRLVAYITGGIGLAGAVTCAITGAITWSQKRTIEKNCENGFCNREGEEAAELAGTMSTVSTVSFGIGLAGLGTAAVLFLTEPDAARVGKVPRWVGATQQPELKVNLQERQVVGEVKWVW